MGIIKSEIRTYFKDRTNIIVFSILILAIIYAALVRSINLDVLAYWGDDGMTVTGTLGVVEHGYPLLQSGNIMYHTMFSFYLRALPTILLGLNEISLRLPSAILGILTVPLIFLLVKELINKYAGLLAAIIVSLNIWQIEYSRETRWYQEFQFLYLLSIYLFYTGFFKNKKGYKIASIIVIFLTILTNHLGITLIFLFIPLLVYKRFKGFFRRDIIISFFIVLIIVVGSLLHRVFFWEVGLSFYETNIASEITNPVLRLLSKFFSPYVPFYSRIFSVLFPTMFYLVIYGWILIILYTFIPWIRGSEEDFIDIYRSKDAGYSIRFPFNLFFLYFIFFSNTVFNGFGYMNNQQRYIFHVNVIFIAIFCYLVFDISRLIALGSTTIYKKAVLHKDEKKQAVLRNSVYFVSAFLIFIFTVNWINPVSNFKVAYRKNGDPVDGRFSVSNTFDFHHDPKKPGLYISENKKEGDLVIATDLFNPYGYTRQIDYWLWTSTTFVTWEPFSYEAWGAYDKFFGAPLIRDYYQLLEVLNKNPDKNVWLITSNSINVPDHISRDVAQFILDQEQNKKITGDDGICSAYLFAETESDTRGYELPVTEENIIKIPQTIGPDKPQDVFPFSFSNTKNQKYLVYGWSDIEPQGTWINNNSAVLLLESRGEEYYNITFEMQALYSAERPQEMVVLFNNQEVGSFKFTDSEVQSYTISVGEDNINTAGYNTIKIKSKYLLQPRELGISDDTRLLSIYFKKIMIEPL
jgi:hypothetical protein